MGRLTEVGQLRWIKEHLTIEDASMRWVGFALDTEKLKEYAD